MTFASLPKCRRRTSEWQDYINTVKLTGKTIHNLPKLLSGSKVRQEQFLLFRELCRRTKPPSSFRPANYGLDVDVIQARNLLGQFQSFSNYLNSVRHNSPVTVFHPNDHMDLGIFESARDLQREVIANTKAPRHRNTTTSQNVVIISGTQLYSSDVFPGTHRVLNPEEETVNVALMAFLHQLVLKMPNIKSIWKWRRLGLKATFWKSRISCPT